jgi:hypothetical protein
MARRVLGTTAAGLVVSLVMCTAATAHVFVAPTHLTIHVKNSTVSGMLVGRPECRGGQTVHLVIDGQVIDSTTTDTKGRYVFSYTPQPPVRIQTRFDGSQSGPHPHRHMCQPSASRLVTRGAVLGTSGSATANSGTEPAATAAFTGADVRMPVALGVIAILVGASLLFIVRRRSD